MPFRPLFYRCAAPLCAVALFCLLNAAALGQSSSSSSAAPADRAPEQSNPSSRPRAAQIEPGGAAVTLEYNEPLFELATALNVCGYDTDLEHSAPIRLEVRRELNETLAASEDARSSRDALCTYMVQHQLADPALNIGQYVSLAR